MAHPEHCSLVGEQSAHADPFHKRQNIRSQQRDASPFSSSCSSPAAVIVSDFEHQHERWVHRDWAHENRHVLRKGQGQYSIHISSCSDSNDRAQRSKVCFGSKNLCEDKHSYVTILKCPSGPKKRQGPPISSKNIHRVILGSNAAGDGRQCLKWCQLGVQQLFHQPAKKQIRRNLIVCVFEIKNKTNPKKSLL